MMAAAAKQDCDLHGGVGEHAQTLQPFRLLAGRLGGNLEDCPEHHLRRDVQFQCQREHYQHYWKGLGQLHHEQTGALGPQQIVRNLGSLVVEIDCRGGCCKWQCH